MNLKRAAFLFFTALLAASGVSAQDQHAAYWKKYGGMPPLDIRVFVDGVQVKGVFDLAKEYQNKAKPPDEVARKMAKSTFIPVRVGQKFTLRVEVAKRDSGQWVDVRKDSKLKIDATSRVISIYPDKSGGKVVGDPRFPDSTNLGIKSVIFYYSDRNIKDEQAAYTEIYFDVKNKP
ncbi:MAG: hypothetical protein V4528_15140 [Pseudomonadota bacterium]